MYYLEFLIHLHRYLIADDNCNNNLVRKHNKRLNELGEFSFCVQTLSNLPHITTKFNVNNIDTIPQLLSEESRHWPLRIANCKVLANSVQVFIDRVNTFRMVIEQCLEQKSYYGSQNMYFQKNIVLENDFDDSDISVLSLSKLRLALVKVVALKLLEFHKCNKPDSDEIFRLKLKSNKSPSDTVCFCAPVICDKNVTAEDFFRKRTVDMRLIAEHKYGLRITNDVGWQEFCKNLGDACVTIDLLQYKLNRSIRIHFNDLTNSNNKGASFILYNCARLAKLFKEFDRKVAANLYPGLPPIEAIDFGLLKESEEWELLYVYVLQFPFVISNSINQILKCEINIHNICFQLVDMCSVFSVYYRRIRILTEPRQHLFPVLHARIYLLKAVEQVLHNALYLLNIQPVTQM